MSVIALRQAGKTYALYRSPWDRLWEAATGKPRHREFVALHPLTLEIGRGEVVGVIGRNGAGKSTLLSLVAGTCALSSGELQVNGRVGALLELSTGFHPDMTGRENVLLSAAIQGFSASEAGKLYDGIVEFSELADFMDQPVKTYSSGMIMRLAFAVATCVQPDILLVDEALSVGDGDFAYKSFRRFLDYKDRGSTMLLCSHSMYYVESVCSRAIWLDKGRLVMDGPPAEVCAAYVESFPSAPSFAPESPPAQASGAPAGRRARITGIEASADGKRGPSLEVQSGETDVRVTVRFASDPALPPPTLAFQFKRKGVLFVSSVSTLNDRLTIPREADGSGKISVTFPRFPLLKGTYYLDVYLFCDRGLYCYEHVPVAAELNVRQEGVEQGMVMLPRTWDVGGSVGGNGSSRAREPEIR